jgi:aminopeptidase N
MENPGLIVYRDSVLFTDENSPIAARNYLWNAHTHELAHQWFGNLVTPAWWDDLWLNESFAEYMGNRVTADVTEYADAWVNDSYARRQWGLTADQRPSSHPVAGNGAVDASAALQDFDGISYAKGCAILRQINATVGDEVFFKGTIDHFERHRFGNATMHDLFESWERAGAEDMADFTDNWLRTMGPDRIELDRAAGVVRRTPPAGHPADRPHRIRAAVASDDGTWTDHVLELEGPETAFDAGDRPVLLDPYNDTWALLIPDKPTMDALEGLLPAVEDPLLRAGVWSNVRSALHNAAVDPVDVLEIVVRSLPIEDTEDTPRRTMAWVYGWVIPLQPDPEAAVAQVHEAARAKLAAAAPTSEEQLAAFRAAIGTADAEVLRTWLSGDELPDGIPLDVDLRWRMLVRLASLGAVDLAKLDRQLEADPNAVARVRHAGARASLPDAEAKAWAWGCFTGESDLPNYELEAVGLGFWRAGQEALTDPYVERYFADVPETVRVRSGWVLADAAEHFFPRTSLTRETLARAEALIADGDLDLSIRRRLVDEADNLGRKLAVLEAYPRP